MRSMTVASLPRLLRFTRVPKISVILSAVRRHKPSSQLRSNRAQDQGPVVEPAADDGWAQPVGGGLQRRHVGDGEEGIVGLAEADLRPLELLLDEAVAVEVVGGLEREERGHPHHSLGARAPARERLALGARAPARERLAEIKSRGRPTRSSARHLIAEVGASQIVLGTDYPFPWTKTAVNHILTTPGLSDAERVAILGETAEKLLAIKPA